MMDPETGQPLFQPVINPPKKTRGKKAADLNTDRHGTGASDVSESLYRNAINRRTRHEIAAKQMELVSNIIQHHLCVDHRATNRSSLAQNSAELRSSVKINDCSISYIHKRCVNLDFPTRCTDLETVLNVCCAKARARSETHVFSVRF